MSRRIILLTGATGYVGGRLLRVLSKTDYRVRCLARHPDHLRDRVGDDLEIVQGDALEPESLQHALRDVHAAYYLIHSMGDPGTFEEVEKQAASNFAEAAVAQGVRRIIYLGGLADDSKTLSPHLKSRLEVGRILRDSRVPTLEFRASIVIGSGSLSFELIRALVERLPVMVMPRWVSVKAQPIAVTDLLDYLAGALEMPLEQSRIVEIGGKQQVSYRDLMREYARQRGLRRWMIPVPILTPRLSSLWLGLVTPLYARVGRKMIDSLRHPTVVTDTSAVRLFPIRPMGVKQAVMKALRNEDESFAQTRWSDALSSSGRSRNWGGLKLGNRLIDSRSIRVPVSPQRAFEPIQQIGGSTGWYYADFLWSLRGFLDLMVGGVGLRRGRRHPRRLQVGDTLDWWRVEAFEPARRLLLTAEMKLPGRAWLEFAVEGSCGPGGGEGGRCTIRQTAVFDPAGLAGLAYWYLVYPLHSLVFKGMLRNIARLARDTTAAYPCGPGEKSLPEGSPDL